MTIKPAAGALLRPSRLEPEPIPRRDFLGLAAVGSMLGALLFATVGMLRLPKAAVLPSPSKKFKVTLPDSLAPKEAFLVRGRPVAVFRDDEGAYAISMTCTHLGCVVRREPDGFHCPCHGSVFKPDGAVVRGPAPAPLPWLAVSKAGKGVLIVDEGTIVRAGTKVSLA